MPKCICQVLCLLLKADHERGRRRERQDLERLDNERRRQEALRKEQDRKLAELEKPSFKKRLFSRTQRPGKRVGRRKAFKNPGKVSNSGKGEKGSSSGCGSEEEEQDEQEEEEDRMQSPEMNVIEKTKKKGFGGRFSRTHRHRRNQNSREASEEDN